MHFLCRRGHIPDFRNFSFSVLCPNFLFWSRYTFLIRAVTSQILGIRFFFPLFASKWIFINLHSFFAHPCVPPLCPRQFCLKSALVSCGHDYHSSRPGLWWALQAGTSLGFSAAEASSCPYHRIWAQNALYARFCLSCALIPNLALSDLKRRK